MPSKKVKIKRNRPFLIDEANEHLKEQLAYTKRSVGSFYISSNSKKIGSGLTMEEEEILMPLILNVPTNDVNFRQEVEKYFIEISTNVPYGKVGLELEVGLRDNSVGLGEVIEKNGKKGINIPINVEDYVRYRHALSHPKVAANPDQAKGNQLAEFFLEDPNQTIDEEMQLVEIADMAIADYQQVKDSPDRVKMLLTLMRHLIRKVPGQGIVQVDRLTDSEKKMKLREIAVEKPEKFHELATDKDMKLLYITDELLSANLLRRIGTQIQISESGEILGETLKEAARTLNSTKYTQLLSSLKAQYDDMKKNKQSYINA